MARVVTFGEIMMRLSPPEHLRFSQARSFDVIYGGGESNVAVSLAHFGLEARFVTRLPANDIGDACENFLRQFGVDTGHIVRGGDRLGIYFLEHGVVHRGSKVIYDRAGSALATIQEGIVDWEAAFEGATWFHWTGITPAVSPGAAAACLEGVQAAKNHGLTVSCDLNYRSKLWKWGKQPDEVMQDLVALTDVAIGNEEDAAKVFGIHAPDTDVTSGELDAEKYLLVCQGLSERFPDLKRIAITLRGSLSASHNTWSAVLWHEGEMFLGSTYDITHVVDRVGAGDSFVAGLIYALNTFEEDNQRALNFAVAASALKHTIFGDFNLVSVAEVEKIMGGDLSGRVSR
jgi:2-dehydro-3-deoxygluconokinase